MGSSVEKKLGERSEDRSGQQSEDDTEKIYFSEKI